MLKFDFNALRIARNEHGLTRAELANRLGWSRQRIHQIESENKGLTIKTIERFWAALNINDPSPFFKNRLTDIQVNSYEEILFRKFQPFETSRQQE